MASESQGSSAIKMFDYQLVEFTDGGTADFVPKWWVYFDVTQGSLVTKFMPPPYNDSTFKTLNILIRSKAPVEFLPVSEWPSYSIKLIGQAETFEEAEEKLKKFHSLSRKSLIYTEDSDYTPDEKAKRIEEQYRLNRNRPGVDLLNVIPIESDASNDSFVDTSWETKELKALTSKKTKKKNFNQKSAKPVKTKKTGKKSNKESGRVYSSDNSSINSEECDGIAKSILPEINLPLLCTNKNKETCSAYSVHRKSINPDKKRNVDADHQKNTNITNNNNKDENSGNSPTISGDNPKSSGDNPKSPGNNPTISGDNLKPYAGDNSAIYTSHSLKQKNKDKEKHKNVSQDTRFILQKIQETTAEISEIRNKLFRLEVMLEKLLSKNEFDSKRGFVIDNNLNLPFNNLQDFMEFDTKLCTEQQFRIDFIASLNVLMDGNFIVTKSILNILKRYLSKEVAIRFTNTKKSGDKLILKNYDFHRCIMEAVIESHFNKKTSKGISEKAVLEAIGIVLANVKDWEGGRKDRLKK